MLTDEFKALLALCRLSPRDVTSLLPFLSHPLYETLSDCLTNLLYYAAGEALSVRKRAQLKREISPDKLTLFRELTHVHLSQTKRRRLIQELSIEIGLILSGSARVIEAGFLAKSDQKDYAEKHNSQGREERLQDALPHTERVDESALQSNESDSPEGIDTVE